MYRDSLIGDLEQRLWKLNVDPSSNEMLDGDYQKCMNIIVHERKLKSKVSEIIYFRDFYRALTLIIFYTLVSYVTIVLNHFNDNI